MNTKIGAFLIVFISILAIINTIWMFKKDKFSTRLFLMWLFVWSAIGIFAFFPSFFDYLMKLANMGNRTFFITTGAILILYIIIFYVTTHISKMNRKIAKLVQEIAILNYRFEEQTKEKK